MGLVHVELHTDDRPRASAFCQALLGWRPEWVETRPGPYLALDTGARVGAGVVESVMPQPLWLPYVGVDRIDQATDRARALGATVIIDSHEGPAGWRSVIWSPDAGEIGLWQQKGWR